MEESEGSRKGVKYVGPGTEVILNQGQSNPGLVIRSGMKIRPRFQAAKVIKPLMVVCECTDKDRLVLFGNKTGSWIILLTPQLVEAFKKFIKIMWCD